MSYTQKISRRAMLKLMGGAAAGAAMANGIPRIASAASLRQDAGNRLVIMSAADPAQNQPLIQAIEAANRGIEENRRQLERINQSLKKANEA